MQPLSILHQRWMRESDAFVTRLRLSDVLDYTADFLSRTLAQVDDRVGQVAKRLDPTLASPVETQAGVDQ
ncbi:hypothetical protein WL08_25500 [Burkholderia ubonensis]|nr:hypothetical protein WL08_25500 [Burkholderia ubonensis]